MKNAKSLISKSFHSFDKHGFIKWQGQITAMPKDGLYLVQLYSWLNGEPTDQKLISIDDMVSWNFYDSNEEMRFNYQYRYKDNRKVLLTEN